MLWWVSFAVTIPDPKYTKPASRRALRAKIVQNIRKFPCCCQQPYLLIFGIDSL
jgi:hypothetical protein